MDISMNANYLRKTRDPNYIRTPDECIRLCAEAGFRVLDYSPNITCDLWESNVEDVIRAANKYSVEIEQSHAPFNFYARRSPEEFKILLERSVEAAKRMGICQLVFHADEYHPESFYNADDALRKIYEVLAPHIEKTVQAGIRVALENIFEDHFHVGQNERSHYCGTVEELMNAIHKFNNPYVGCCWDFGHAKVAFGTEGQTDAMRALGGNIICTHVHDNYNAKDMHLMPFTGDTNWEEQMRTLKEIGYKGNLTFEFVYGNLPNELIPGFLRQAYDTGCVLVRMFENEGV